MHAAKRIHRAHQYACCALAFVLAFPFLFASLGVVAVSVCWLLSGEFRETARNLRRSPVLLVWVAFFLLHAASWFWSDNKAQSSFDLQTKLSLLLLPAAVGAFPGLDRKRLEAIFAAFLAGLCVVVVYCLGQASVAWIARREMRFFYHPLVTGLDANAVYMAWYVLTGLSLLLFWPWQRYFNRSRLRIAAALLLGLFFVLLASRTLLLFFGLLVLPVYLAKLWRRRGAARVLAAGGLGLLLAALLVFSLTDNPVRKRYLDVMHNNIGLVYQDDYAGQDPGFSNLTLRLFVWRVAYDNLREHRLWLYGAGNGDVHGLQNDKIRRLGVWGMDGGAKRSHLYDVNAHNMYLQTALMLGLPGLLLFLVLVLAPFASVWRLPERGFFFLFHGASLLFFMQEAALQTQAGIVFYTFFSALFWSHVRASNNTVNRV